jgi:TonB family protein
MNPPMNPGAMRPFRPARERWHLGKSIALSVLMHAFAVALFALVVCWLGAPRLKFSFAVDPSQASPGPAPAESMTLEMMPETRKASAPTSPAPPKTVAVQATGLPVLPKASLVQLPAPSPSKVQQVTKLVPVISRTVAHTQPVTNNHPKPKPKYADAHAIGTGQTASIAFAQRGTAGFPHPDYPPEAFYRHEGGTVHMEVVFGPGGSVESADVQQSSGVDLLDIYTRAFIYAHWKDASFANSTIHIPIIYDPGKTITSAGP